MPSPNTNIQLDGDSSGTGGLWIPVLGYFGSYLGSGAGQIQWTGSGGFASLFDVTIQLNGTPDTIAWGAQYFVADGHELRFGHVLTDGTVIWDKGLDLGTGTVDRTIRLTTVRSNAPNLTFGQAILGGNQKSLFLVGNGGARVITPNPDFHSDIKLYGTTLDLREQGSFTGSAINFDIRHGGILSLYSDATHNNNNRIHDGSNVSLNAGNLRHVAVDQVVSETLGTLSLPGFGANTAHLQIEQTITNPISTQVGLNFSTYLRDSSHRSTLDIRTRFIQRGEGEASTAPVQEAPAYVPVERDNPFTISTSDTSLSDHAIGHKITTADFLILINADTLPDFAYSLAILPWATVRETNWALPTPRWVGDPEIGGSYQIGEFLLTLPGAHTGAQSTWSSGAEPYNININGSQGTLTADRTINSLRIAGGTLNLGSKLLTINSGGLLTVRTQLGTASNWVITNGRIGTASNRPLYMHIYSNSLQLNGNASLVGWTDVVKTGPGELRSYGSHQIGSLYINQGMVDLRNGTLTLSGEDPRIYVGDGAGTDVLKLQGNRRDQIQKQGGGLPSITLQGTPYNPRGPEYGGDQAILQMGGNTKLSLANLHIQDRGTIDWTGGEVSKANILYLDTLTFSGPDAILFMKNWYEYEDRLLVKSNGIDLSYLQNIRFEGYENFPVIIRKYDWQYWEITPFGTLTPFPEPTTTGAILGAVGIGLVAWRRRKTGK